MAIEVLMDIVTALVILIGLVWLGLIFTLIILRPSRDTLREGKSLLPSVIRLIRKLSRDRTVGRGVRIRLFLLLAYLASPIDLIPDFLPVIGWADDVIVLGLVLRSIIKRAGSDAVFANWDGTNSNFAKVLRLCRLPAIEELG